MKRLLLVALLTIRRIEHYLVVLSVVTVGLFPVTASGQLPDYPPEFSPLRTSRPAKSQRSLVPPTKFVKVRNAIPNRYIVVLNDDVVAREAPLAVRRARIAAIANRHALANLGTVGFVYETALNGYSIELPNEAAARAISQNPQVKWVEEEGQLQTQQDPQPEALQSQPPWGLDAIDGSFVGPVSANGTTNGVYIFNATGAGVTAYVLDTGINRLHQEFISRAPIGADFITGSPFLDLCVFPMPNSNNNDCFGHGTHVAGVLGGATYGAAKQVNIVSVKVCTVNTCPNSAVINGVNWVTSNHLANPSIPAVANMSLAGSIFDPLVDHLGIDSAVSNSIAAGVTYVISAGNSDNEAQFYAPGDVAAALTVGAVDSTLSRWFQSNFGSVDLFAPGVDVLSALTGNFIPGCVWSGGNTDSCITSGTSQAAPHVAGAVAMYLQGRTGTGLCSSFPIQGSALSIGGPISTCPDRVARFIDANANLNQLSNINGVDQFGTSTTSPNRFLWTLSIPAPSNPVDNQRFFVWQHYADFLVGQPQPDEGGLNFWTGNITGACGTGFNANNSCTHTKRIDVSRAFWVAANGSLFNANGTTNNSQFVHLCYQVYLRRSVPDNDSGFQFWLNDLSNNYGNPANYNGVNHLIDAFSNSADYRKRFGQP
jgi:subtilisin family serine protease